MILIIIFLILFISNTLFSQELEKLLKEYKEAAELYKQTKKESLGHVIIYTREDLERMQAYRLYDVLKSLRFITTANNRFGVLTVFPYGLYTLVPRSVRLYINDKEVSSINTGSPFLVWENFPLDIIEHIEIYEGQSAIELGNEPASLIIKLYTVPPQRENVNKIRISAHSRDGYEGVFYRAVEIKEDFSYIFFLSRGTDEKVSLLGNKNRFDNTYGFFGLYFEKTSVEVGYGYTDRDMFLGFSADGKPDNGFIESEDVFLSFTAYADRERTAKFVFTLSRNDRIYYEKNREGLLIPPFLQPSSPPPVEFYEKVFLSKVDIYLSKEFKTKSNSLLTAVSYKLYSNDVDRRFYRTFDGRRVEVGQVVPFNRQEILSAIVENKFSINPRNLLIFGAKLDKYERNGGFKDFNEYILRAGYISSPFKNVFFKGFVARSYDPVFFYDTEIAGRDLETIKIPLLFTAEVFYKDELNTYGIVGGYMEIKDAIIPDRSGKFYNDPDKKYFKAVAVYGERYMNEYMKVQFGASTLIDPETKLSPTRGGFLRITSEYKNIQSFAEIVYRSSYKFMNRDFKEGYDLSAGISYGITEDLYLRVKGENLLNEAIEIAYPIFQTGRVVTSPVRGRTVFVTLDWYF